MGLIEITVIIIFKSSLDNKFIFGNWLLKTKTIWNFIPKWLSHRPMYQKSIQSFRTMQSNANLIFTIISDSEFFWLWCWIWILKLILGIKIIKILSDFNEKLWANLQVAFKNESSTIRKDYYLSLKYSTSKIVNKIKIIISKIRFKKYN